MKTLPIEKFYPLSPNPAPRPKVETGARIPNDGTWTLSPDTTGAEVYLYGQEVNLLYQALDELRLLNTRGYETARIIALALGELAKILRQPVPTNRWRRRAICGRATRALRAMRIEQQCCLEHDFQYAVGKDMLTFFLLKRATDEFERAVSHLSLIDMKDLSRRRKLHSDIIELVASIMMASDLERREKR